jgi:hypothetical protein
LTSTRSSTKVLFLNFLKDEKEDHRANFFPPSFLFYVSFPSAFISGVPYLNPSDETMIRDRLDVGGRKRDDIPVEGHKKEFIDTCL